MTKFEFAIDNKPVSLDTAIGALECADADLRVKIEEKIKDHLRSGSFGGGWEPFEYIKITDPYRDIRQFTACILNLLPHEGFPEALKPHAPRYTALHEDMEPCRMFDPEDMRRYEKERGEQQQRNKEIGGEIVY